MQDGLPGGTPRSALSELEQDLCRLPVPLLVHEVEAERVGHAVDRLGQRLPRPMAASRIPHPSPAGRLVPPPHQALPARQPVAAWPPRRRPPRSARRPGHGSGSASVAAARVWGESSPGPVRSRPSSLVRASAGRSVIASPNPPLLNQHDGGVLQAVPQRLMSVLRSHIDPNRPSISRPPLADRDIVEPHGHHAGEPAVWLAGFAGFAPRGAEVGSSCIGGPCDGFGAP
jgi:hypothetical protein